MELTALILFWAAVAITAAILASRKGRSGILWFLLCTLLSPLAILPLLALGERKEVNDDRR